MAYVRWSPQQFNLIDLEVLDEVLASKPDMYGIWQEKKTVGICATRRNMAQYHGLTDDRWCPNCLEGTEQSSHLNWCMDEGQTLLFDEGIKEWEEWLAKNEKTDLELQYWLIWYLQFQGERPMCSLGSMSDAIQQIALDIDRIGWTDILHRRIPITLCNYQQSHCASINSRMNGKDWA